MHSPAVRVFAAVLVVAVAGISTTNSQVDCQVAGTCRDCIGLSGDCVWCSSPGFLGVRCVNGSLVTNCSDIENPQGGMNQTLSSSQSSMMEQFTPLAADLLLRVGSPQTFTVDVTPSANYPLDIYILMDLSTSMQFYLDNLQDVTGSLAATLNSITNNAKIGFGAFNEKPIDPFTLPFQPLRPPFRTDYSYRHIVSLTDNITIFQNGIANISTVSNDDGPEALLEGLLQAVVCKDLVGWRDDARKLILVFTDQRFHTAGDGKLAGLFQPHDGNCYVSYRNATESLDYTMWGRFDYPSVGQVQAKLKENNIIPIFSSIPDVQDTYMLLAREIRGLFQPLSSATDLFLTIIERSFNTTSQRIELLPSIESTNIQFKIVPTCPPGSVVDGSACDGVLLTHTASFEVSVTLTRCPLQQEAVSVGIPGFGSISVSLSGICECLSCEADRDFNNSFCSGQGDIVCGICECHEQWFGERCQCDSPEAVNRACPLGASVNSFCSSRGTCDCGLCTCNQPPVNVVPLDIQDASYFGDGCECDNFRCPVGVNGSVCSGKGDCECNQHCACYNSPESGRPFHGDACQCLPAEEVCFAFDELADAVECSGHGQCRCEGCRCDEGFEGMYCGVTIRELTSCDSTRQCVECAENIASSDANCSALNCLVTPIDPVETDQYFIEDVLAIQCDLLDMNDCLRPYFYSEDDDASVLIHVERTDCGGLALPVWAIVVITVGGLLLLGVLLLILIKCIIICLDRYEVYRWEKERGNLEEYGLNDNPLYTNPDQKYTNIAYGMEEHPKEPSSTRTPGGGGEEVENPFYKTVITNSGITSQL